MALKKKKIRAYICNPCIIYWSCSFLSVLHSDSNLMFFGGGFHIPQVRQVFYFLKQFLKDFKHSWFINYLHICSEFYSPCVNSLSCNDYCSFFHLKMDFLSHIFRVDSGKGYKDHIDFYLKGMLSPTVEKSFFPSPSFL